MYYPPQYSARPLPEPKYSRASAQASAQLAPPRPTIAKHSSGGLTNAAYTPVERRSGAHLAAAGPVLAHSASQSSMHSAAVSSNGGAGGAPCVPCSPQLQLRSVACAQTPVKEPVIIRAVATPLRAEEVSDWSMTCACRLCSEGEEAHFVGKVRIIDRQVAASPVEAVDSLNRRLVWCPEDCCMVYSPEEHAYYLLYRIGRWEAVCSQLGLAPEAAGAFQQHSAVPFVVPERAPSRGAVVSARARLDGRNASGSPLAIPSNSTHAEISRQASWAGLEKVPSVSGGGATPAAAAAAAVQAAQASARKGKPPLRAGLAPITSARGEDVSAVPTGAAYPRYASPATRVVHSYSQHSSSTTSRASATVAPGSAAVAAPRMHAGAATPTVPPPPICSGSGGSEPSARRSAATPSVPPPALPLGLQAAPGVHAAPLQQAPAVQAVQTTAIHAPAAHAPLITAPVAQAPAPPAQTLSVHPPSAAVAATPQAQASAVQEVEPCHAAQAAGHLVVNGVAPRRLSTPREALERDLTEAQQVMFPSLEFIESLGSGEFGQVFRGMYRNTEVAIKQLYWDDTMTELVMQDLAKEIESFRHLRHKRLVRFIGACLEVPHPCLVTEYMPGGSLHHLLHVRKLQLPLLHALNMCLQVADGVMYLHAQTPTVVHRDLKSLNVVLDLSLNIKICDFGLTEPMERTHITKKNNGGSPRYMAPELFDSKTKITEKIDVWAMGCIFVEICGGPLPYETISTLADLTREMLVHRRTPDVPGYIPEEVRQVICGCLSFDYQMRPSCKGAFEQLQAAKKQLRRSGVLQ